MSLVTTLPTAMRQRSVLFAVFLAALLLLFFSHLHQLILFSFSQEHYSHFVLIPFVSLYLLYMDRGTIFSRIHYSTGTGITLVVAGILIYLVTLSWGQQLNQNDYLCLMMISFLASLLGAFIACYGASAARAASFPLLFLLFMIPIPSLLLDQVVYALQWGSAWTSAWLFQLTSVPFLKEGLVFALPGLTIEVAKECSGIRSSMALVICGVLAGHFFLRSGWQKGFLMLVIIPLTVLKNGIRIVTLSLLYIYVDEGFMTGNLHQRGGIVFFLMALALLMPLLWALRRTGGPGGAQAGVVTNVMPIATTAPATRNNPMRFLNNMLASPSVCH